MPNEIKKSDFVQSLEKGLRVISVFDSENQSLTLTEVGKKVGLTRANARRILLTLEYLGYVKSDKGKYFSLTPRVLTLGYSYLSAQSYRELAIPYMQEVTNSVKESCSMSVLDGDEIVYVARVHTQRIMTIALAIGTRLPVHSTSMGKVLAASLPDGDFQQLVDKLSFESQTDYTLSRSSFLQQLDEVKRNGYAIADQELEIGVRSIAVPIKDKSGNVLAALNISGHASRVDISEMKEKYLPPLQEAAGKIETALKNI